MFAGLLSCRTSNVTPPSTLRAAADTAVVTVESAIPGDRLAKIKAALPPVEAPKLQAILHSSQTFWYDQDSMTPSYEAAVGPPPSGANSNDKWFNLLAPSVQPTGDKIYDRAKKRWRFPFGTTFGTDDSTNAKVANFLWLPAKNGKLLPVAYYLENIPGPVVDHSSRWIYPNEAVVGEVLFIDDGTGGLLPSEIRVRTRHAGGWATNAFRPFPTAQSLADAVRAKRPSWQSNANLKALVDHLQGGDNLSPKTLTATGLPGTFDQSGYLDKLPDFGDPALVRELLTTTPFASSYKTPWRTVDGKNVYAASTDADLSIVPNHYTAGLIAVDEDSCMRCHKEAGKKLSNWYDDIILYGEVWGQDGIFSFHPYDESAYALFWVDSPNVASDNRRLNPKLVAQGIVANFDASVDQAPDYPPRPSQDGSNPQAAGNNLGSTAASGGGSQNQGGIGGQAQGSSNIVEFHIARGTGSGNWNEQDQIITVRVGQTLRIINDDQIVHTLHTNGVPCPHGTDMGPGGSYDCRIEATFEPGGNPLYDHYSHGLFWFRATN